MADMKLGVDICFGKKRWPEPEAWLEIVTRRLGLNCIEFDSDFLDPFFVSEPARFEIAAEIRDLAREYGVEIHSYFTGTMTHCANLISAPDERVRRDGIRWCEEAIKLASTMGAKGIAGHFDTISARNVGDPEKYSFYVNHLISAFQHLSRISAEQGLEFLLWEQMYAPSEVPYTLDQAEWMIKRANNGDVHVPIYLAIDVGHACCQNFASAPEDKDPYAWIRHFAHLAPVIHLQQTNGVESCHWPFTKEYNKKGIIDGERVIETIDETEAKEVYLILEIFFSLGQTDEEILDAMEESVEYWRRCLDRAAV